MCSLVLDARGNLLPDNQLIICQGCIFSLEIIFLLSRGVNFSFCRPLSCPVLSPRGDGGNNIRYGWLGQKYDYSLRKSANIREKRWVKKWEKRGYFPRRKNIIFGNGGGCKNIIFLANIQPWLLPSPRRQLISYFYSRTCSSFSFAIWICRKLSGFIAYYYRVAGVDP